MNILKNILVALGMVATVDALAVENPGEPDFAHPQQVLRQAYKVLKDTEGDADAGPQRVKALLEICTAAQSIDPDSVFSLVGLCDDLASREKAPAAAALMTMTGAEVLYMAYESKRYVYDRLTTPDEPLPADIREWNGSQFRQGICRRVNQARDLAAKDAVPLGKYAGAVNTPALTLCYFPDVRSFVASRAASLLESVEAYDDALRVRSQMKELSPAGSAAFFYWSLSLMAGDDFQEYYKFYVDHISDEYARDVLVELVSRFAPGDYYAHDIDEDETEIVTATDANIDAADNRALSRSAFLQDLIERSLERFPGYWNNASLKNALASLRRSKVEIEFPSMVCPGRPAVINLTARYAATAGVTVYKTTAMPQERYTRMPLSSFSKVNSIKYAPGKDVALARYSDAVVVDGPGVYYLAPFVDGVSEFSGDGRAIRKQHYIYPYSTVIATPYVPLCFGETTRQVVAVTDFVTGRPVRGIRVVATTGDGKASFEDVTDKNGIARFKLPAGARAGLYVVQPGGEKVFMGWNASIDASDVRPAKYPLAYRGELLPDRPIYHPGDKLQWLGVVDYSDDNFATRNAAAAIDAEIRLLDANRKQVARMEAATDKHGRVSGEFILPVDGLTGNYRLEIYTGGRRVGTEQIMVSDYRIPTFEVSDLEVARDLPSRGEVTVRGRAVTYSGMAVAGASVVVDINSCYRWRWWQPARRLGSVNGTTGADGRFEIVVPRSLLAEGEMRDYLAGVTVTSATAETATASRAFTTGRPYEIVFASSSGFGETPEYIKAESSTRLPVKVLDSSGQPADIKLDWKLTDASTGAVEASGSCSSAGPVADLDKVHGGYYRLVVSSSDSTLAEPRESSRVILYNVSLNSIPQDLPLLVAEQNIEADVYGRASVQYGVGRDNTWVYAALGCGDDLVEVEAQERDRGFRHLSLQLPEGAASGVLEMAVVDDGRVVSYRVNIQRAAAPQLTVSGESFRDRIVPGARERWKLKIEGPGASDAAVAATMYNHALDALCALQWPAGFATSRRYNSLQMSVPRMQLMQDEQQGKLDLLKTPSLAAPVFRFLPQMFYGRAEFAMAGAAMDLSSADGMVMKRSMSMAMNDMAAPEAAAITEESEEDGGAPEVPQEFSFRDAEVAQAFWMPLLATDADGNVTLDFEVPDANTTWRFHALAWTGEMKAGSLVRDIVANKPVMVQPNLPRFLRQGDKTRVLATIYNNSDKDAQVGSVVEIFDAGTMKVISTVQATDYIAAGASAVVAIDVDAPLDATSLGYRVRATDGVFSDGEQALIPIESAQCDVVESQTFYLNPGEKSVSVRIPSDPAGSYTLLYCQNPSWSIVKALPGLVTYEATTSTEAVHTLFAACTASGIVERTPAVADALREWRHNPLVSRLEQNDALKTVELKASPWVQAAQTDTERMARLALLLDPSNAATQISKAVKLLSSLANEDGGLRWGPWDTRSSQWATSLALHDLGLLRLSGNLPADSSLDRMMRDALAYLDRNIEKDSDGKVAPDMGYAVVRSMWKDVTPSAFGRKVVEATLSECTAAWRKASTARKANMAILLSLYGRDAVARQIVESLSEFAVKSASQGVSFPSVADIEQYAPMLMAFGRVDPSSALIDGMRQWLVVREQATAGLGAYDATQLVGAFLASGTPWHTDNSPVALTVGGVPLDLGDACSYGGEATLALGRDAAGKTLKIAPAADVPSYGAVICSYRAIPSQVKSVDCDGLSIEKRMMLVDSDGSTSYKSEMPLGSRVRVLLTLHVTRDMQYVNIVDDRAAALEPLVQTPGMVESGGACFYRENRDASTRMFISYLPKGTYQISYDCTANVAGTFAGGLATVQSALAPALVAHSAGSLLIVTGE